MTIGTRITRLRNEKGYTQEYLAQEIGISRQAVHKWEKDETRPDTENLIALAKVLGTTVEYIVVGNTKEKEKNKKLPKLWTYIITITITAVITFIITVLFIANWPVSFDAGACGGGFATAVYDQYANQLIEENYFYLTRDLTGFGFDTYTISPIRESRDINYEGKAIYMTFDIEYNFADNTTLTVPVRFIGERKWIQQYEWKLVMDNSIYDSIYHMANVPAKI